MSLITDRSGLDRALIPHRPLEDDPSREIRLGALVAGVFFVLFLGWAAVTRLDAAAQASGQVSITGYRQSLASKDGGVVAAIHVVEGQQVKAGDVLVELAGDAAAADERGLVAQVYGLQAQEARLLAEQSGAVAIAWPAQFAALTGNEKAAADQAMKVQQDEFDADAAALAAQKNVLRQRSAEYAQQVDGFRKQIASADTQEKLLADELAGVQTLAAKGFAPLTRVRALERSEAEIGGQRGQYVSSIAEAREQAGEAQLQILQTEKQRDEDVATQLRDATTQLGALEPKLAAARDVVDRDEIRAPVAGAVTGLSVFHAGAVIQPGQPIMDIVPRQAPMVIQARVSPRDVDDLHVGQSVETRFTSLQDRGLPILKGAITRISAESLTDKKTGRAYFTIDVSVPLAEQARLARGRRPDFDLRPGTPVEVLAPLRKRTVLQYLIEPLTDVIWRAGRER
ncbi:MAG TPA: HlyD family type I secretion periplasmic adaptor subunit [Caulobacteraceae bacterium]|nr:HlyD family type I secretion periplasmic adaptor subunit [Caulobacteraceae bacterium]